MKTLALIFVILFLLVYTAFAQFVVNVRVVDQPIQVEVTNPAQSPQYEQKIVAIWEAYPANCCGTPDWWPSYGVETWRYFQWVIDQEKNQGWEYVSHYLCFDVSGMVPNKCSRIFNNGYSIGEAVFITNFRKKIQ